MKRRTLRADEKALWEHVARTTVPLRPKPQLPESLAPKEAPEAPKPAAKEPPTAFEIAPFDIGSKAKPQTRIPAAPASSPRMDAKAFRKLARGKLEPEGRIDLHGMRADEAHAELNNFILRSHAKGRRLVLVITGKGQRSDGSFPYQRGILRRQVPHWLQQNPVAPIVLQVTPASPRHGGEGALYVYLRRRR